MELCFSFSNFVLFIEDKNPTGLVRIINWSKWYRHRQFFRLGYRQEMPNCWTDQRYFFNNFPKKISKSFTWLFIKRRGANVREINQVFLVASLPCYKMEESEIHCPLSENTHLRCFSFYLLIDWRVSAGPRLFFADLGQWQQCFLWWVIGLSQLLRCEGNPFSKAFIAVVWLECPHLNVSLELEK